MSSMDSISTRQDVEDAVVRMFVATDERDWATLQSCFASPFILDMTSMQGGEPATMTPEQVSRAWAEGFKPLDHVHHQIGNVRIDVVGDRAHVKCYGVAFHHRAKAPGLKSRVFVGTYDLTLTHSSSRWLITRLVFHLKFIDGNLALETGLGTTQARPD